MSRARVLQAAICVLAAPLLARAAQAPPNQSSISGDYSKKELAWGLGHALGLTALAHVRGLPERSVTGMFGGVTALANALGAPIFALPKRTGATARDSAAVLNYLLRGAGKSTAGYLEQAYGADHAALFELAVKAQALNLQYGPGQPAASGLGRGIKDSATRSGLPSELWQPVCDRIAAGSSLQDVEAEVGRMRTAVRSYLATPEP